jgi:hypothetical protein
MLVKVLVKVLLLELPFELFYLLKKGRLKACPRTSYEGSFEESNCVSPYICLNFVCLSTSA